MIISQTLLRAEHPPLHCVLVPHSCLGDACALANKKKSNRIQKEKVIERASGAVRCRPPALPISLVDTYVGAREGIRWRRAL